MKKTVLITGASTGIGKAAAKYFLEQGWNVAATMRNPEKERELTGPQVKLLQLDVTDSESIRTAVEEAIGHFGKIDAVVNNAGYGAVGVFEASTAEQIKRQFDTNVFGLMNVTSTILPHFRTNKKGIIINVSSIGGRLTFPLYSLYHSTKWAVEGFSESLHYELKPLGIQVKLIEPGAIKTDFYSRSQDLINDVNLQEYQSYFNPVMDQLQAAGAAGDVPELVAKTIYKAASDGSSRLRYPVGKHAKQLLPLRKLLPEKWFYSIVRANLEKNKGTHS